MKQLGRINWVILAGLGAVLAVALVLFSSNSSDSPTGAASRFLDALARKDAKTLVETSFIDGMDDAQALKAWEETLALTKHYYFFWVIRGNLTPDPNNASVRIGMTRNATDPSGFEENYQVDLVKRDGRWKVRVSGLSRTFYPFLPRPEGVRLSQAPAQP